MIGQEAGMGFILGILVCSGLWLCAKIVDSVKHKAIPVLKTGLNLTEGFSIWRSVVTSPNGTPAFYEVRYHDVLVCRIPFLTHKPADMVDGVRFEDILAILSARYNEVQKGDYANPHNAIIIGLLAKIREEQGLALAHVRAFQSQPE